MQHIIISPRIIHAQKLSRQASLAMLSVEVVVTFGDGNVVFMLQITFFINCNKNLISQLNDLCIRVSSMLCCFIAAMESRIEEVRKVHVVYSLSRRSGRAAAFD